MNSKLINDFCTLYQSLNKDNLDRLSEVYSDEIIFTDPIHEVNGIGALTEYFSNLYENLNYCHFHIDHIIESTGQACIVWRMEYAHNKIKNGQRIHVDGASHLQYSDKIDSHHDYLDLGQMLYEHLPIIGTVIKSVKMRASR